MEKVIAFMIFKRGFEINVTNHAYFVISQHYDEKIAKNACSKEINLFKFKEY